jgi:beta-glucosidase
VDVTNTGLVSGKEVVQLYVGAPECDVFRPVRELKGFEKVELAPGETKTVTFTLDKRAFAYWSIKLHDWFVADGDYSIQIGRSSRDIVLCQSVKVTGTAVEPFEKVSPDTIFLDLQKNPAAMAALKPVLDQVAAVFGAGGGDDSSDAAKEAVSDEMGMAMMNYMPLRAALSFGMGQISEAQLQAMLDAINA